MGWKDTITEQPSSWRDTIQEKPEEKPWYDVSTEGLKEAFTPSGMLDSFGRGSEYLDEKIAAPVRKFNTEALTGKEMDRAPTGAEQYEALGLPGHSDQSYKEMFGVPSYVGGDVTPNQVGGTALEIVQDPITAVGGAMGKVGEMMDKGLSKIAPNLARKFEEISARQGARAMGLERGTARKLGPERELEIGRQARDENLFDHFSGTDEKIARNEALKNRAVEQRASAYKSIDDAGASTFNPLEVATNIEKDILAGRNASYDDTQAIMKELDPYLSNIMSRGDKPIPMGEAQKLLDSLKQNANFDTSRSNMANDVAKQVYFKVRQQLNEAAGKSAKNFSGKTYYHGTNKVFDEFGKGKPTYFSENPEFANKWATAGGTNENVRPVKLNTNKVFDPENIDQLNDVLRSVEGNTNISPVVKNKLLSSARSGDWTAVENPEVQKLIKDMGYDSFYVLENGQKNIAVLDPEQAMSVFDPRSRLPDNLQSSIEGANKTYSVAKDTDMLLTNQHAKEAGNKMFGLTDNIAGVGAAMTTAADGGFNAAKTAATVGAKKLGEKYGNQILSKEFKRFADLVEKSPEAFGKYGKALKDASLRGGSALGVTDFMLQQQDPEYRRMKQELEGE